MAEIHRVLKPGGVLICTHWTRLEIAELGGAIMGALLGAPPPPPPPHANPLSLREAGALEALASGAGFTVTSSVSSQYPFDLGTDEDVQFKMAILLFKTKVAELDPEPHPKARAAFATLREKFTEIDAASGAAMVRNNVFTLTTMTK